MKTLNKLLAMTAFLTIGIAAAFANFGGPEPPSVIAGFDVDSIKPATLAYDPLGRLAVLDLKTLSFDPIMTVVKAQDEGGGGLKEWGVSYAYSLSGRQYLLASAGFGPDKPLKGGFGWNYGPTAGLDLERKFMVAGVGAWIGWKDHGSPLFGRAGVSLISSGAEKPDVSLGLTFGYRLGG